MELIGNKVKLRPFKEEDASATLAWRQDRELIKMAEFHYYPVTPELEKEWLLNILNSKSKTSIYFAIEDISASKMAGFFHLKDIDYISRNAWLGIIIGDTESRGKGYGKETMQLGLGYAFNYLNLRKILLEVLDVNTPAINLYTSLGFKEEGLLVEQRYCDDKYYDVKIMSFIRS